jgi:hypothetical protein
MANVKERYSRRIDVWMTEELADTTEAIAADHGLDRCDVVRMALRFYYSNIGALPAKSQQVA